MMPIGEFRQARNPDSRAVRVTAAHVEKVSQSTIQASCINSSRTREKETRVTRKLECA